MSARIDSLAAVRTTRYLSAATDPPLRFSIQEAASMLRMSRVKLYYRIREGAIRCQKDGGRTYITREELLRYVESCKG